MGQRLEFAASRFDNCKYTHVIMHVYVDISGNKSSRPLSDTIFTPPNSPVRSDDHKTLPGCCFQVLQLGGRVYTSEFDVCNNCQILMSKVGPRSVRIKIFVMAVDT